MMFYQNEDNLGFNSFQKDQYESIVSYVKRTSIFFTKPI